MTCILSTAASIRSTSQTSKEETKITREGYIRSCQLAHVSLLAKREGYKVGATLQRQFWSDPWPGESGACWVGNDHQPPAKCWRNFDADALEGSQRTPGGFVLSTPKVKLVKQIKCLINLGILELAWQEGKNTYCKERNNNTCQRGSILASQF